MKPIQKRAILVCILLVTVLSVYSARLIQIQVVDHEMYAARANAKHIVKKPVYAQRGRIIDINHEILATNTAVKTVYADASHILLTETGKIDDADRKKNRVAKISEIVGRHLGIPIEEIEKKILTERRYIVLKHGVDELVAHALQGELRENQLRGIYFNEDFRRIYPNGDMLCHVLGWLDHEKNGLAGIEKSMDEFLRQRDGYRFTERDRTGREIVVYRGYERPAQEGLTVQTTVNLALQAVVEEELKAACEKFKPEGATIIMMNPHTGAIMAMASWPVFDNNDANNAPSEVTRNHAVLDMLEPGSTFKIVAVGAAIEEGLVTDETKIFCEGGRFFYGGRILRDHHPYGSLSVHEILVKSSNIGVAKLALQMGEQRFHDYVRRFGFGDRTGIDLPGEIPGRVNAPGGADKLAITRIPMGQAIGVTPIQLCTSMSVIANGGNLMMPQVVASIIASDGRIVSKYKPVLVRNVISRETALKVTAALKDVVGKKGTAPLAMVPGFAVAGKTGTAQKAGARGGYMAEKYIVSFCGFLPADDPAFVIYVLIDDAKPGAIPNYGGTIAAPIFANVARKAARILDLKPDPALLDPMEEGLKQASNTKPIRD